MMGGIKQKPVDVLADYEAETPVENSWNDEPLETEWLRNFGKYLNEHKNGPSSWVKVKRHSSVRDTLESIRSLTPQDSPEREYGSKSGVEYKRLLHSELNKRFRKAGEQLLNIEKMTAYRHPNVIDFRSDPLDWPPDRKDFAKWIIAGKEMTSRLQKHFKSISHAGRKERDNQCFLIVVFELRDKCRCKYSEVAALIGSGMAASGRMQDAIDFHQEKLKDDLRRLKRSFPKLYRETEDSIKAQRTA